MELAVSLAVYAGCLAAGWWLGRSEDRPVRGVAYAALLGPLGLLLFWAGRDWRRDRAAQQSLTA